MSDIMRNNIDKLLAVARAAQALRGDLKAHNEDPTHFNSWFVLEDALIQLKGG
jgi:hypothetical protein